MLHKVSADDNVSSCFDVQVRPLYQLEQLQLFKLYLSSQYNGNY
jgi:hypothetical protein